MNFIEEYTIPNKYCDQFINYFKKNNEYKVQGSTGNGVVDLSAKDCKELYFYNETQESFILDFFKLLSKHLREYMNKYEMNGVLHSAQSHKIQHYEKSKGYFKQHYERSDLHNLNRELVYMLYCNDLKNGGTNFPFQKVKTEAKKGKMIIWPAFFTHPHHGIISKQKEKYIVTGWFNIK
jgi:hypothetical protein|tara:strand:+ start:58 stop:594 length:537 start_codon:yes stop_codon:yes gene_type:complete